MLDAVPIREQIVVALRSFGGLTALVPSTSIYGERVPDQRTFPFIRITPPNTVPFRTSCHNGDQTTVSISVFAKGADMSAAAAAGKQIRLALDQNIIDLGAGETAAIVWTGGGILPDVDEPDSWHSFSDFVIT